MKYCDLHCHTNYSDGTCTPEELVNLACLSNLSAIALTDHNTIGGLPSFHKACEGRIEACGGCEFTTELDGQELHLLGLFLDETKMDSIQSILDEQLYRKELSNQITIENLSKDGMDVSYEEFVLKYGTGVKNRVHIARYLMEKGIVSSVNEAFNTLLSSDGKYYKEPKKLDFLTMIPLIQQAGGVSIWAHPLYHVDILTCEKILMQAKEVGLDGVEVYYSTYSKEDTLFMKYMCEKYQLMESGGSDFHGENKPGLNIGTGYGNLSIPMSCFENLKELSMKRR